MGGPKYTSSQTNNDWSHLKTRKRTLLVTPVSLLYTSTVFEPNVQRKSTTSHGLESHVTPIPSTKEGPLVSIPMVLFLFH